MLRLLTRRTIMASTPDLAALRASITALNEHIHTLKSQSADAAAIAAENKKLGELKKQLGQLGGSAKADSKKDRLLLKTPKVSIQFALQHV